MTIENSELSEIGSARKVKLQEELLDLTQFETSEDELLSCPTCGNFEFNLKPSEITCSICGESVDPNAGIE